MTRTGKIAKLPEELREELNRQLERGVHGRILVAWLNGHPAAQAVLREFFEGAPVNEQNLSAWRRGGFADWQTRRQFFDQVREVATSTGNFEEVASKMAEHAAHLLAAHYAIALSTLPPSPARSSRAAAAGPDPYASLERLKPLAAITRCVMSLRRSDHDATRLKMHAQAQALAYQASAATMDSPPQAASPEREDQPKSSQIKVVEIHPVPTSVPAQNSPSRRPPNSTEKPPASLPSRLILTFPPSHPLSTGNTRSKAVSAL